MSKSCALPLSPAPAGLFFCWRHHCAAVNHEWRQHFGRDAGRRPKGYSWFIEGEPGSHSSAGVVMQVRWLIVLLVLGLSACGEQPVAQKAEKGDQGPPGSEGPAGPAGPIGISGTVIRFVEGECRQACTLACEDNERILSTYAINPGGSFVFDADNKATFRPQRQGVSVKVVLACAPKG